MHLQTQSVRPARIVVVGTCPDDLPLGAELGANVVLSWTSAGLTRQRNHILATLRSEDDIIVFFDDDFVPSRFWLERALVMFARHEKLVGLTGDVLADGIKIGGIDFSSGQEVVEKHDKSALSLQSSEPVWGVSPYGCNMAFRTASIVNRRFDERLVLYAWQEDRDFAAQACRPDQLASTKTLWGVHLGIRTGRISERRLGYSQVANPLYMLRKGTMSWSSALRHVGCNLLANSLKSIHPERFVDRRGRLMGNLIGFYDLARGRLGPERALDL